MKRGTAAAIAAVVLAIVAAGCGGDDDASASLTKAQFIKQGDKICQKAEDRQVAGLESFQQKNGSNPRGRAAEEELASSVGVPPLSVEAEELSELPLPEASEEQAKAVVEEISKAVEAAKRDPASLLGSGKNPFEESEQLARKYGFKVCGGP